MLGNLTVLWYHKSIGTEGFSGHAKHGTGVQRLYQRTGTADPAPERAG